MTDDQIRNELAVCDAATAGPWRVATRAEAASFDGLEDDDDLIVADDGNDAWPWCIATRHGETPGEVADSRFIAAARTGYPEALREVLRLRGLLREARGVVANSAADIAASGLDPHDLLARIDAALEGTDGR